MWTKNQIYIYIHNTVTIIHITLQEIRVKRLNEPNELIEYRHIDFFTMSRADKHCDYGNHAIENNIMTRKERTKRKCFIRI